MTERPTAPADYLAFTLAAAHKAVHQSLSQRARAHGIQIEAWRVLEALDSGERLTMGDLARAVMMNPPALSKLVDRMVSDGLVHRQISRDDMRQVNLLLTALGAKRMVQVRESVVAHDTALREALGEAEAAQVHDLLRRLAEIGTDTPPG